MNSGPKQDWKGEDNPYAALPRMVLLDLSTAGFDP